MPKKKKKKQEPRRLYDVIYFISILAAASVFLAYFSATYTEMTFEKRAVAEHTAAVLNVLGIDAMSYNRVIRVEGAEDYRMSVFSNLSKYASEGRELENFLEMRFIKPSRGDDQIINAFVSEQQKQGNRIYVSMATISSHSKPFLEVDIIPECVGWMGIFAVSALIIAYPRVERKKRLLGIVIALPLMYAVNILRLATTFASGYWFDVNVLYFTHDILWKTILLVWALALWLFWIYFVVEEKSLSDLKKAAKKLFKR